MPQFAQRIKDMERPAEVIKNLFNSMNNPNLISFTGGVISKECLPVDKIREIVNDVMRTDKRGYEALTYGPVQGVKDLREVIVSDLLAPKGVKADADNISIVTGGLEGLSLLCQLFIEPGDTILVESPTFVHAVETFSMFQANLVPVNMDDDGIITEELEAKIIECKPKMIYVIPTFQNPTGRTLSLKRRKKIAELGSKYDVIVLEDDPYRDIRYSGTDLLPIKAFDTTGHTVLANSFSKIFSPGSRLGYVFANAEITEKLIDVKSASNSHSSMLPQIICAEFFKRGYYPEQHKLLCDIHREKRNAMMESIDKYFPEGTKRTSPDGGLFIWVELPGNLNATELLVEATTNPEIGAAYIAGEGFFVEGNGKGSNCMRLGFGSVTPKTIEVGIKKLGELFCSKLQ